MIYLDTSVLLAHVLAEDRHPPEALWQETLLSSRLLQYETWTRIHAAGLTKSHGPAVTAALDRIAFVELRPPVLARALEPFHPPVRTLDALHLATLEFLDQKQTKPILLATYDERMAAAAKRMKRQLYPL